MSECYLPHEIVVEILLRLPPKSLVRCTSVCKSWRSLITHPSFISDHLRRPIDHFLLFQLWNKTKYPESSAAPVRYSLCHDDDHLTEFSALDLPRSFEDEFYAVGVCNGLVCIASIPECDTLIVCNPCIRRYVNLPKPRDYPDIYYGCIGFGFDSGTNDYKVVRLTCIVDDSRYGLCAPKVELYSLATGFWKSITAVAPVCFVCSYDPSAFIDGIVHWGAQRRLEDGWYCFILSFDFRDDVFGEIMLPPSLAHVPLYTKITVIGGGKSLAVYHATGMPCSCTIWVMKEYGVVESWTKLFTFNWMGFCLEAPLLELTRAGLVGPPTAICCRNSGKVLLLLDEAEKGRLYSLDAERKTFTDLNFGREDYKWCLYSGNYAESLVLLDKASGLVSY